MDKAKTSVRATHKLETTSLIHEIAANLALKNGLDGTKIEDIALQAGISRRTFFNYFPTKEDAVLGLQEPVLTDEIVERFNNSREDVLTRITMLSIEVMRTSAVRGSSLERRRELRTKFPQLIEYLVARTAAAEKLVRPISIRALKHEYPEISDQESSMFLNFAKVILKTSYETGTDVTDATIAEIITLFKNTIHKII